MRDRAFIYRWLAGALLGAIGLVIGYVAPLKLDPGMSQGPLVGILFTGPLSLAFGLGLGFVSDKLRLGPVVFAMVLVVAAAGVAAGTLYLSLPDDRWQAFVIDAETRDCRQSSAYRDEALARMRSLVDK